MHNSEQTQEQRLTALLERLRERCAETAENVVYGDQAAHRIRLIELDVAVREYLRTPNKERAVTDNTAKAPAEVDVEAAIAAGFKSHGYQQGTKDCIAFYRGACWQLEQLAAPSPQGEKDGGGVDGDGVKEVPNV